jgi:uncharacterized protein with FMN-binding domain
VIPSGSSKKIANSLVSASCAAVLAVYIAGYTRTESAADRFAAQVAERRPIVPDPPRAASPIAESLPPAPQPIAAPKHLEPKPIAPAETPAEPPDVSPVDPPPPPAIASPATIQPPEPAPAPVEPKPEPAAPPTPIWKDGTYTGWGYSRHGNIEAAVVIEAGRIASATISQCRKRYSCSVIERLPPQVAQRQSPDVDYVSGATQSADAFYGAVVSALNKAK